MAVSEFTSGPLRELSAKELGTSGFSDFELLSDSGHNRVYRAMHAGKRVVLKAAREEEGNTTRNRLLLQREYDIMHAIDCIYVVKTWQMTDVPELGTAIVMEYVQGRTLDRFLQENPSLSERRRVADELMEALAFLHERQIVHGDLKSSNILITDSGNHVCLIDFGFSDTDAYVAKIAIARDNEALKKIVELLFPGRMNYIVRTAVLRRWRLTWILPVLIGVLIAVMATIGMFMTYSPEDSAWISLRQEVDSLYSDLYDVYADSITNMPEKQYDRARELHHAYAMRIFETKQQLIADYPQYEEQIEQEHVRLYNSGYTRLSQLFKDYPLK